MRVRGILTESVFISYNSFSKAIDKAFSSAKSNYMNLVINDLKCPGMLR